MPPTIYMSEDRESSEDDKKIKSSVVNKKSATDAENVGQCVKRKLDNSHFNDAEFRNIKRQRRISDSSTSSDDDDYGTDSELIAIDQNKHKNSSCRYKLVTDYGNLNGNINRDRKVINNAYSDAMCTPNMCHPIDINEEGSRFEDVVKKFTCTKISNANTRHLLEIAVATFRLSKKNKEFQLKLIELQTDTKNLLKSVFENPENHEVKEKLKIVM